MWIKHGKINQWACYNRIWSWSPMACETHGTRASVTTKTSAFGLGFCLLSPSGHVFHTAWETMIKSYNKALSWLLRTLTFRIIWIYQSMQRLSLPLYNTWIHTQHDCPSHMNSILLISVTLSRVTIYTAGHLHTAVPHCSNSRAPIVHTAVPRENNEHGCVYLRCRAVCKLPGCVEGHLWLTRYRSLICCCWSANFNSFVRGNHAGGRLNKKDGLTRYGDSHVKDKTS